MLVDGLQTFPGFCQRVGRCAGKPCGFCCFQFCQKLPFFIFRLICLDHFIIAMQDGSVINSFAHDDIPILHSGSVIAGQQRQKILSILDVDLVGVGGTDVFG